MAKKYLDLTGLTTYHRTLLGAVASSVEYDTTNDKITYTTYTFNDQGTKTAQKHDVVTAATLAEDTAININLGGTVSEGVVSGGTNATIAKSGAGATYNDVRVFSTLPEGITVATTPSSSDTSEKVATTRYVQTAIAGITEPMIFEGGATLTADSSDTTKCAISVTTPASSADIKKGFTYKVTTIASSPTYTGTIKVGDTLIAAKNNPTMSASWVEDTDWTLVPSGDEEEGTVTSVDLEAAANTPLTITGGEEGETSGTPITVSGTFTITHNDSGVTAATYGSTTAQTPAFGGTASVPYVTVNATGHTTAAGVANVTIPDAAATASNKGLVSVPTTGHLSVDANGAISVPIAESTTGTLGVVKEGDNVSIGIDGTINVATAREGDSENYEDPVIGLTSVDVVTSGLTIDSNGIMSVIPIVNNEITALFA